MKDLFRIPRAPIQGRSRRLILAEENANFSWGLLFLGEGFGGVRRRVFSALDDDFFRFRFVIIKRNGASLNFFLEFARNLFVDLAFHVPLRLPGESPNVLA